jgi:hypothetical protein
MIICTNKNYNAFENRVKHKKYIILQYALSYFPIVRKILFFFLFFFLLAFYPIGYKQIMLYY